MAEVKTVIVKERNNQPQEEMVQDADLISDEDCEKPTTNTILLQLLITAMYI